jgi:hypothetical protein
MSDVPVAEAAYVERLALAESIGEPGLVAEAHYDLGFISMLRSDGEGLRRHEEEAVRLYEASGDEAGTIRARQALVLGVFLAGDFGRALELEERNLEAFRRTSSRNEIADSLTFMTAVHMQLDQPEVAWSRFAEAVAMFAEMNSASGLARTLGMAAILLFRTGDPELAARVTGAAYELVRLHGVMMAPVMVLHLPDPRQLATERLGAARAGELMTAGAATPLPEVIAALQAIAARPATAATGSGAGAASGAGGA